MDAALVPRERRLFSTGEDPISGPVARFISSTPDRDVQAPARAGKEKGIKGKKSGREKGSERLFFP